MAVVRRVCPRCGNPLSAERIAKRKRYCYRCGAAVIREQKDAAHDRRVEKLYGLRPGEYRKLYVAQNGRCPVKNCPARGRTIRLAVDHDHAIGLGVRASVRGLMCKRHNRMIGYAGDDPEVFLSLADYLVNPPAREILT